MSLNQPGPRPRYGPPKGRVSGVSLLLLGAMATLACAPQASPDARDVILITVDTLRADRLGFMGYERARTPVLDGLASRGVVFASATTPVPRTTPGLASLHTGLWPHHHGSREVGDPILAGKLMAETLTDAGYWTIGVSANSTAGRREGFAAGFAEFTGTDEIEALYGDRIYDVLRGTSPDGVGWADTVTAGALGLVEAAPRDRPLMLWVFYFDPHFLYAPPSPWQDDVEADECWSLYDAGKRDPGIVGAVLNDDGGIASRAMPGCSALYDAEIAYTDDRIGQLLEGVARLRGDRQPLIVFTADHGENLGEGGLFYEHGDNVSDAAIRVPLVFAAGGSAETSPRIEHVETGPVSLIDVLPTVLSLLEIDLDTSVDGTDLSALLGDLAAPGSSAGSAPGHDRVTFSESAAPMYHESARHHIETGHVWGTICLHGEHYSLCQDGAGNGTSHTLHDRQADPRFEHDISADHPEALARLLTARAQWPIASPRSLTARGARFKLVRRPRLAGGYTELLVDPIADPMELTDLAAIYPDEAARLQRELDAWMREWSYPSRLAPDAELGDRLRSLGYIR